MSHILLLVSNVERSRDFYTRRLGFELGTNEDGAVGLTFGGGYLTLHADHPGRTLPRPRGAGVHIAVEVDDVDGYRQELVAKGVAAGELREQPGQRDFELRDPEGYVWVFLQLVTRS